MFIECCFLWSFLSGWVSGSFDVMVGGRVDKVVGGVKVHQSLIYNNGDKNEDVFMIMEP